MSQAPERFELWRQDDNGQRFLVARFASRRAARQRLEALAVGGHRQIYWIEPGADTSPEVDNLFAGIPPELPEELTEVLLETPGLRLERIASRQQATPPGFWYDQEWDEWVLLVSGSAEILFADPAGSVVLQPGDHLLIPARCRHRVAWTDPQLDTLWLALFVKGASAPA